MKITDIECYIVVVPDLKEDATSSSQDDVVVLVHTDEGITGIGETDTGPWLVKAAIEAPGSHSMAQGIKKSFDRRGSLRYKRALGKIIYLYRNEW